ncbi:MAG: type III PLP-dependent enzyme [Alphaproteobacteria bacterium]|nr:type III PLP-dependent enzyme [Alphaproteobacteria bacterium]
MRSTLDPRFDGIGRGADGAAGIPPRGHSISPQWFEDPESMVAALRPSYPVYCLRPHTLAENARLFLDGFPGLVMYAVKCNPHPAVLHHLFEAGIRHFDTASLAEIAAVREGLPEAEAYFMHPVKARAALLSAAKVYDVRHYVIDHADELAKIVATIGRRDIDILVRLSTPGADVLFELSRKFGAPPDEAVQLLRTVHEAGFRTGIAFHVGSQCGDPGAWRTAMDSAAAVIRAAGVPIRYLDVGGGFPANYDNHATPPLEEYFTAIRKRLATMPVGSDCTVMCEPGRALVANAISLVTQVHLRKGDSLYINDGIYHSMSEQATVGIRLPTRMIRPDGPGSKSLAEFMIYGPTCDSTDVLPHTVRLPADIGEGDWIEFGQIGAYSSAMATRFNGFHPETFVTVKSGPFRPLRGERM